MMSMIAMLLAWILWISMMLMICKATSLGMLCLMKMIFLHPPSFDEINYYDDSMSPIYADYGDDMYAIKNNDKHEVCHHDLIFTLMIVILLSLLPLLLMRRNLLMWRAISFLCFCVMKGILFVMVILLNFFMMLLKIIMWEEHMHLHIAIISSFLSMCWKFWKLCMFYLPMLVDSCSHELFSHKIPMNRK